MSCRLSILFVKSNGFSSISTSISITDTLSGVSEASEDDVHVSDASPSSTQSSLSRSSSQSQSQSQSQLQPQHPAAAATTASTAPNTTPRTPSPLPSTKAAQSRIQTPQPVHAAARILPSIVPDRAPLGLHA
ncbi:hypothetical protein EW145_g3569 [Phellinidium pouzarii]|uniref:Uncharacterized protein n=1 Tax=Phellinidium pouzarii TaxID=167371 RepID=A0A4S4L6N3_9AGAM|nr:hypothetical protein EW145_g3569 [Phellinidium pouzarii]